MAAVAAIAVFIHSFDIDRYKPLVEAKLRTLTGTDLHIDGPLRFRVTTTLAIVATNVRVANPEPNVSPDFLRVDRLYAFVSLRPLLRRVVRIERTHLEGLYISLRSGKPEFRHWQNEEPPLSGEGSSWSIEVVPGALSLVDARISFRASHDVDHHVLLSRLTAVRRADGVVILDGSGAFDRQTIALSATVQSDGIALNPRSRIGFTLAVVSDVIAIRADGIVDDLISIRDVAVNIQADGKDTIALARSLGWKGAGAAIGGYAFTGRLSGSRRVLGLYDIRFKAGRDDVLSVNASGRIADVVHRRGAALDIDVQLPRPERLTALLADAGAWLPAMRLTARIAQRDGGVDAKPFALTLGRTTLSGNAYFSKTGGRPKIVAAVHAAAVDLTEVPADKTALLNVSFQRRFLADRPLSVEWLHRFDVDLTFVTQTVRLSAGRSLSRASAHLRVQDGRLVLSPLRVQLAPRSPPLSGRIVVQDTSIGIRATIDVAGASIPLADILSAYVPRSGIQEAPTQIDVEVSSTGRSPDELIRHANGAVRIVVGRGRLPNDVVDFGASLITRLLGVTRARVQQRATLICATSYLPIRDGVITFDRNVALLTSNVRMVASGVVDLREKMMDVYVYTRATEGIGLEAGKLTNMFKLRGPLTAPTVSINPKGVVQSGVFIGAAVATGGMSLLFEGLANKAAADIDPCGTALVPDR